jgi:hypothetical protein
MRIVKYFLFAALVFWTVAGCRKEKSAENGTLPEEEVENQWQFMSDTLYKGTMDSALTAFSDSGAIIAFSGPAANGTGNITIQLFNKDRITAGVYENQNLLFQYSENGVILFQNSLQQSDPFTVTINSIDSVSVSGVFSGVVQDGTGGVKQITDGKFSSPIKVGDGVNTGDSIGTLMVWAAAGCPLSDKVTITLTDADGSVIDTKDVGITATQPDCAVAGSTSFNLPAGDYFISVPCGDTTKTKITIAANTCTSLQLDFSGIIPPPLPGDWFPLSKRWTYGNPNSSDTLAIDSTGTTTIDGKLYTSFTNDETGDVRNYRKDDTAYYEYTGTFGGVSLDQPAEFIFLKNDKPVGETWESEEYTSSMTGPTVTGKLRNTITNSGFKAVINGKTYYDLIEVKTELLIQFGGVFQPTGSSVVTVYAKGIGVVSYQEFSGQGDLVTRPIINYDVVVY